MVDPSNEDTNESEVVDPSNEDTNESEVVDPSNENTNKNKENEVSNNESEFEIDEANIVINKNTNIIVTDEYIIPEEKIIANELDQEEDVINEMFKLAPEQLKTNKSYLKNIKNCVDNFKLLKNLYSIKDENNEIKGYDNREHNLKNNYENHDYSNNYLIPIVDEINTLYEIDENESNIIIGENLNTIDDDRISKQNNEDHINEQQSIREKYKRSNARVNYSYKNELNETYNTMNTYMNKQNVNLSTQLTHDTPVMNDNSIYFSKNKFINKNYIIHTLLGDTKSSVYDNEPIVKGEPISLKGYLRLPNHKNNIKQLNKHTLINVVKSNYSFNDLYNDCNDTMIEKEIININLEIGNTVKIFFLDKNETIIGEIINIDDDTYDIKPINLEDPDNSTNILSIKKNKDILIYNIDNGNRNSLVEDENLFKSFMFSNEKITQIKLKEYLNYIIPENDSIIKKFKEYNLIGTLNNIIYYLDYYGLSLDNINNDAFKEYRGLLKTNNKKILKESITNNEKYTIFIKKQVQPSVKNFVFISNKSLKNMEKFYGEYPYYKSNIDNVHNRIKWLLNKEDRGYLYFKNIVKNIEDKLQIDTGEITKRLNHLKSILEKKKLDLENKIESEKKTIIKSKNKCPDIFIAKEYYSIQSLENDNNKEIKIDKDKLILGETDIVKPNTYAILSIDNNKKIYKRIVLADESHIWNLETSLKLDSIISSNKDFCNSQLKTLKELNILSNPKLCSFSDIENKCYPKQLTKLIIELNNINEDLKDNTNNLKQLEEHIEQSHNSQDLINYYSTILLKTNLLKQTQYEEAEKELEKEKEKEKEDIDPQYEMLYMKIDLYLEKINKLTEETRYKLLENLINKYGREANLFNDENKEYIYCKYGNKIILCKHNLLLIDFYKTKNQTDLERVINTYGIENNGRYWCKHCGQEIYIATFETVEGFTKSGARNVTHETIEEDEYTSKYENTELIETLQKYLNDDSLNIENGFSSINIYNILNSVLTIMGIKLNDTHQLDLIKDITNLCKSFIKNKYNWQSTYKGKPKHLDKSYENYVNIYTIIYSISSLFITLQTAIPNYIINKPHQKCKTSLDGYPLDTDIENKDGLIYISCILEQFKNTDSIWKCLKKLKILQVLTQTITKLAMDDYNIYRYTKKRTYIDTIKLHNKDIECHNKWTNFKPSLELFSIENEDINSKKIDSIKNKKEASNYYSLKIISEIDKIVNNSSIETTIYIPSLLSHSCCLDEINNDYNNINYFIDKNKTLNNFIKNTYEIEKQITPTINTRISISHNNYSKLQSFKHIVMPPETDIDQEIITELFVNYIDHGVFKGHHHLYNNHICVLTGENKQEIKSKIHKLQNYYELLNSINNLSLIDNKIEKENLNILKNFIIVIKNNKLLKSNIYINNVIKYLVKNNTQKKIEECWNDFQIQIDVERQELLDLFETILGGTKTKNLNEILLNLGAEIGLFPNIYEEELELYGEDYAKDKAVNKKIKFLKKYIIGYLSNTMCKIKNSANNDTIIIPETWKVQQIYIDKLIKNAENENKQYNKYIANKNQGLYENLYNIISNSNKIQNLVGETHITKNNKIIRFSKLTNKNISMVLEFVFLNLLKNLLLLNNNPKIKIYTHNFTDDDITTNISSITDSETIISPNNNNNNNNNNNDNSEISDIDFVINPKFNNTSNQTEVGNLLNDILKEIEDNRAFTDKFTENKINESIEKKSDNEKESTLKFMEDLDKESRQSLKTMIALGFDTWKGLSTKENKFLYFKEDRETIEQSNVDTIEQTEEEIDTMNRDKASNTLGENLTEDQYQDWLEQHNRNNSEDQLAQDDMDVMPDDDGDFDDNDEIN